MQVDLNCDMGESFGPWKMGDDDAMLDLITSANVACGLHGGDPQIMLKTAKLAKQKGVAIGAHPGFHDLEGFGRRQIQGLSASEIETLVAYQIGALQGIAALAGHRVTYVKIHGALSNMACEDEMMANALAAAIKGVDPKLAFVVLPFSKLVEAGEKAGLKTITEVFADRAYEDNGLLVSRRKPGAVLHDPEKVAERVQRMVEEQAITSVNGKVKKIAIDTVCIHGDTPAAVSLAKAVRKRLDRAKIKVAPFSAARRA
ncbi:MAG TPA: 5-oxoprolinase subunit PxpA [Beijerinckiaceae bacterium]|nr:5-oxoprolinase subunit PxpA [Beijerinckiaceae bacterium]